MRALAHALGVEATIVECRAPAAVLRERLARRAADGRDPSDATAEVLALQQRVQQPPAPDEGALALATDATPAEVAARVDALAARLAGGSPG
jgi:predicted kinase